MRLSIKNTRTALTGFLHLNHIISAGSQSELVLTFGLGDSKKVDRGEVMWPSGIQETFKDLNGNRTYTLIETQGVQGN